MNFVKTVNLADSLFQFWRSGSLTASEMQEALVGLGFFDIVIDGKEAGGKLSNVDIPLGEWRKMKVRTNNVRPPIPTKAYDWNAWFDGEEEKSLQGWGKTEVEAVKDLISNYMDEEDDTGRTVARRD